MKINGYEIKPGAYLYGVDLRSADLRGAYLRGANLRSADLRGADLYGADLYGADLRGACLHGAYLHGAYLHGAYLHGAYLNGADLRGACLHGANLRSANLYGANLRSANLYGANLYSANLYGANLSGTVLPHFQIPQEGELIVWKKSTKGLIKLLIPSDAKRTASLVGRKCRASYAKVLMCKEGASSLHDHSFKYYKDKFIYPDKWDDDIRVECTHGIHFFLTKEEAEGY